MIETFHSWFVVSQSVRLIAYLCRLFPRKTLVSPNSPLSPTSLFEDHFDLEARALPNTLESSIVTGVTQFTGVMKTDYIPAYILL